MLGILKIGLFTVVWLPLVALGLYGVGLTVYRLFLSPLAKFPGPKLAALTRKYEFYYEAVLNYEYLFEIKRMHSIYGEFPADLEICTTSSHGCLIDAHVNSA